MNRREFLKTLGASAVMLNAGGAGCSWAQDKATRPNFILIFTDDQGYQDLGCFGSEKIKTPHIDRMAEEGMRMTDFYVAAPVCTPSRAALMTGCYPKRVSLASGVLFPHHNRGLNPDEITIAALLKQQGYATACIGKWHLGHEKPFLPTSHGFDQYFGIPYSNDMAGEFRGKKGAPLLRGEDLVEQPANQSTLTQRYTAEALQFIEQHKDVPFFLYLPHTMPHLPLAASKDFLGKSAAGFYGDVIEEIDWSTGEILKKLRELDLSDHTVVVFLSDNGPWLKRKNKDWTNVGRADPLRDGKSTTYEGGMRVPCIFWGPGRVAGGSVSSEVCTAMDIYPTFAHLAGAVVPQDRIIDGHDIGDIVAGKPGAKSPTEAFYYYNARGQIEAIRRGQWKLRETKGLMELYDLEADISESKNLAEKHPELVKELREKMLAFDGQLKEEIRPVGQTD